MAIADEASDFALRVRTLLDQERAGEAERAFVQLLELRAPPSPGLTDLFASFSPEAAARLIPAIVEAVRCGRLSLDADDTHRLMSLIPERDWSNGYLSHRARIESSPRFIRELERRLAETSLPSEIARLSRALEKARQPPEEPKKARAHPIYRSAADGVKPSIARGPPHLGGPMPELLAAECRVLVRWTVERILQVFEPSEETRALSEHSARIQGGRGAWVTREAKRAVRSAATMMASIGEGAAFIEELDREIMRIEVTAMLQRAQRPALASFEVLARGEDERGKPAAWLLRAGGDRYLFLARIRKSWICEEGERDEVIASIPDRWFDLSASALG